MQPRSAPSTSLRGLTPNGRRGTGTTRTPGEGLPNLRRRTSDLHHCYDVSMAAALDVRALDVRALGLAPVYSPAQAAEILRSLGLEDLTECALRTRAYRRQIPFHQNGRRLTFTIDDIREIAEGQPHRPETRIRTDIPAPAPVVRARRRRSSAEVRDAARTPWRARKIQGA